MRYPIMSAMIALGAFLAVILYVGSASMAQGPAGIPNSGAMGDQVVGNSSMAPVHPVKGGGGKGGGGGKSMHSGGHHRGSGFFFGSSYPLWGYPYSGYSDSSPVNQPSCVWNGYKWSCYDPGGNLM